MFTVTNKVVIITACCFSVCGVANANDWPMWRGDASRSAATAEQLPKKLFLKWTIKRPALEPAWVNQKQLQFDVGYQPIVASGMMFVGSSANDSMTAYHLKTGEQVWQFFAEGPIRFAPAASEGKILFSCDDGYLYCLNAIDGQLLWKFQGGPTDRKVIGNERLISAWPARGAPVVSKGKVYFAASIWPFMGTFIYALDVETGSVIWKNDGTGSLFIMQPHDSPAFGGVTPQGYLAISGDNLIVPNGRSAPACFDLETGEYKYFHLAINKRVGNYAVAASDKLFFNSKTVYDIATGKTSFSLPTSELPIITQDVIYCGGSSLSAYDIKSSETKTGLDRKGRFIKRLVLKRLWEAKMEYRVWLKAGNRLYCSGAKKIRVVELGSKTTEPAKIWKQLFPGEICSMIAADGHLLVTNTDGEIHCYCGQETPKPVVWKKKKIEPVSEKSLAAQMKKLIQQFKVTQGYCLVYGLEDGEKSAELARQTQLQIVGIDSDAKKVAKIRGRLNEQSLYGSRISLHVKPAVEFDVSPYLASLIISEKVSASQIEQGVRFVQKIFHALRPYGGVAVFELSDAQHAKFEAAVQKAELQKAEVTRFENMTILKRVGALPDSGDWTHQYADAANSSVSKDKLVKAPLGVLWFGGSTNENILPRHGHGPSEQVVGGRLFIEGVDSMRAMDVYTGRVLWEAELPGLGKYFDNTSHQPGANSTGSNYVSVKDGVYIAYGKKGLRLDPATGKTIAEFKLPADDQSKNPTWGYIGVWENLLVVGSSPIEEEGKRPGLFTQDGTTSKRIVVFDRYSGKVLWKKDAEFGFRHNAIALGNGKLFCIDRLPDSVVEKMKRRGLAMEGIDRLIAFEAKTGEEIWAHDKNIFGTWLGYSQENGILLQSGRAARDMLKQEPANRMMTYRGEDGKIVWDKAINYGGPCLLHHQKIITQNGAVSLLTGEKINRSNPITHKMAAWSYSRSYGCNSAVGSECLLTFRSAAAGYFDLLNDAGTGNFGGFKSGCTSNLIVANGVLNAPDYTRTCSCSYQNQTSLALFHMPEMEMWTFNKLDIKKNRVRKLGINFGAPGDRKSADGTLWIEYPYVGGPTPKIPVEVLPKSVKWFRNHSSTIKNGGTKWITASGVQGVESVKVIVDPTAQQSKKYTVRLFFSKQKQAQPGKNLFSVSFQNKIKIPKFDPASLAANPENRLMKEFTGIDVKQDITVQFKQIAGFQFAGAVLCGIEFFEEANSATTSVPSP